jgi:hypothetical protein
MPLHKQAPGPSCLQDKPTGFAAPQTLSACYTVKGTICHSANIPHAPHFATLLVPGGLPPHSAQRPSSSYKAHLPKGHSSLSPGVGTPAPHSEGKKAVTWYPTRGAGMHRWPMLPTMLPSGRVPDPFKEHKPHLPPWGRKSVICTTKKDLALVGMFLVCLSLRKTARTSGEKDQNPSTGAQGIETLNQK